MLIDTGKQLAPADNDLPTTPDNVLWEGIRNCQEAIASHDATLSRFRALIDKQMAELERRAKAREAAGEGQPVRQAPH